MSVSSIPACHRFLASPGPRSRSRYGPTSGLVVGVLFAAMLAACAGASRSGGPAHPAAAESDSATSAHDDNPGATVPADGTLDGQATPAGPKPKAKAKPKPEPEPEPKPEPISCDSGEEFGPLALSAAEAQVRHGLGEHALVSLLSSKQRPVEVCGVAGEQAFLLATVCADGSAPLSSPSQVMRARRGSMGPGGRCGKIVDLYEVACPEKTYAIYIDMYFCGPDESFR